MIVANPIPDRGVVEAALQRNTDAQKLVRRLLKLSLEYSTSLLAEDDERDLFPSVKSVRDRLSDLNEDAKILRRQLRLIDDYEGTFGGKKGSPETIDADFAVVSEEPVALAS